MTDPTPAPQDRDAVEALAASHDKGLCCGEDPCRLMTPDSCMCARTAATLRALLAEREAMRDEWEAELTNSQRLAGLAVAAEAQVAAARERALREARSAVWAALAYSWHVEGCRARTKAIQAIAALAPTAPEGDVPMGGTIVRLLKWEREDGGFVAHTDPYGSYVIRMRDDGMWVLRMSWSLLMADGVGEEPEPLMEAAQADFERRVMANLRYMPTRSTTGRD